MKFCKAFVLLAILFIAGGWLNPGKVAIVNYTNINIYTRAGLGLYKVFDLAPVLGNQAIWIDIAYAADTVHISHLGCLQIVASGLVQF